MNIKGVDDAGEEVTCSQALAQARLYLATSPVCEYFHLATASCCPSQERAAAAEPCPVCPGGLEVGEDVVVAGLANDGTEVVTCGRGLEMAAMVSVDSPLCAPFQVAATTCCPSQASPLGNSGGEGGGGEGIGTSSTSISGNAGSLPSVGAESQQNPSTTGDAVAESCKICANAEVDWEARVSFDGSDISCGEFGWMFDGKVMEGSEECLLYSISYFDTCCKTAISQVEAFESCNICGNAEIDWESRVDYEGSEIACGEFGWIFNQNIPEGSDTCLNYRAAYFDTCCKVETPTDESQVEPIDSCNICGDIEVDWEVRVDHEGNDISCGEFGWIFKNKVEAGSEKCTDYRAMYFDTCCKTKSSHTGCGLCATEMDGDSSDIEQAKTVQFDGVDVSCAEVNKRIKTRFGPASAQCADVQKTYAHLCCVEICNVCSEAEFDLNLDATVTFAGENVKCHELNSIFLKKEVSPNSPRCETSKNFYADSCCTEPTSHACDLCSSNGIHDGIPRISNSKVSYDGNILSCPEVYHSLHSNHEQSSEHCIRAREELSGQCCDAIDGQAVSKDPTTQDPKMQDPKAQESALGNWMNMGPLSSPASACKGSISLFCLFVGVGLVFRSY